uniref:Protein P n=1 Tax=White sucker hepatitis B virus TaxID=1690672 RepID=A0A7U3T0I4_9HEPA|nr:polymerase [White sucker hepatitis B virus]
MHQQLRRLQGPSKRPTSPQDLADQLLGLLELGQGPLANQSPNLQEGKHKAGFLNGLYMPNPPSVFNPNWLIPSHKTVTLHKELPLLLPSRTWKYLLPARFWPKVTHWYSPLKAVKDKYPGFESEHKIIVQNYLAKLFETGVLYKRASKHSWLVHSEVPLYQWEKERIISKHHGQGIQQTDDLRRSAASKADGTIHGSTSKNSTAKTNISVSCKRRQQDKKSTVASASRSCYYPQAKLSRQRSSKTATYRVGSTFRPSTECSSASTANSASTFGASATCNANRTTIAVSTIGFKGQSTIPDKSSSIFGSFTDSSCSSNSKNILQHDHFQHLRNHGRSSHSIHHDGLCIPGTLLRSVGAIPRRVTGGVFLVDKNPHNSESCRLVVDFSQFSRHPNLPFPKYRVPNLDALQNGLPANMYRISLDLSEAFYHIPMHPGSSCHLLVSDGLGNFYGFRKAAMGVGLSPWLLHLFTSILATWIRSYYPIHCIAYMDDFLLSHSSVATLSAVVRNILALFAEWGILINVDKSTPEPLPKVIFLGYAVSKNTLLPAPKAQKKALLALSCIQQDTAYDFKIIQRLTGLLAWVAPFTDLSYLILQPLYEACVSHSDFSFTSQYLSILTSNFTRYTAKTLTPKVAQPSIFVDASDTLAAATFSNQRVFWVISLPSALPIHIKETIAAVVAVSFHFPVSRCRALASDSMFVCYKQFKTLPLLFALRAYTALRRIAVAYVHTSANPADGPTRHMGLPANAPSMPLPVPLALSPVFWPRTRVPPFRTLFPPSPTLHFHPCAHS